MAIKTRFVDAICMRDGCGKRGCPRAIHGALGTPPRLYCSEACMVRAEPSLFPEIMHRQAEAASS